MYKARSSSAADGRQPPLHAHQRRGFSPPQLHQAFRRPAYQQRQWEPVFSPHYRDRPPGSIPTRPNFIIQLRSDGPRAMKGVETREIVQKLNCAPQKVNVVGSNCVAGTLFYEQWSEALETMDQLWEMKLNGGEHNFLPRVVCNIEVPSDKAELTNRLRPAFLDKLKGLMEGDLMQKWLKKSREVVHEINRVSDLLSKPQKIGICNELLREKKGLEAERDLILKRVKEFESGVKRIMNYLEEEEVAEKQLIPVFHFSGGEIDWGRIYRLMMRECRRLDDGLPIYAHRQDILKQIHSQQVALT